LTDYKALFTEYINTKNQTIKDSIVKDHYSLVVYVARRFIGRGESLDDLIQVGTMGMLKAIENYDPSFNAEFATYAMPAIVGEIKHYFRDHSKLVKLPRRLHEINSHIKRVVYEFHLKHDTSPTIEELANIIDATEDEIIEAMEAGEATKAISLDSPSFMSERSGEVVSNGKSSLMDSLGIDHSENRILDREALKYAIVNILNRREQRIIYMRFYDNLSQQEIASYLDLSQMHVSRIIQQGIFKLKRYMRKDNDEG